MAHLSKHRSAFFLIISSTYSWTAGVRLCSLHVAASVYPHWILLCACIKYLFHSPCKFSELCSHEWPIFCFSPLFLSISCSPSPHLFLSHPLRAPLHWGFVCTKSLRWLQSMPHYSWSFFSPPTVQVMKKNSLMTHCLLTMSTCPSIFPFNCSNKLAKTLKCV